MPLSVFEDLTRCLPEILGEEAPDNGDADTLDTHALESLKNQFF